MIVSLLRIFIALFLVGVSAQADTCINTCLQGAISSENCYFVYVRSTCRSSAFSRPLPQPSLLISSTNTTCVCTNTAYRATVAACLQASCTAAEQAAAKVLQQSECETCTYTHTHTHMSQLTSYIVHSQRRVRPRAAAAALPRRQTSSVVPSTTKLLSSTLPSRSASRSGPLPWAPPSSSETAPLN